MALPVLELEGTVEEIRAQLPDLPDQRFHVTLRPLDPVTPTETQTLTITEKILARARAIPSEDRALLPVDLAEQHDHYISGWEKR